VEFKTVHTTLNRHFLGGLYLLRRPHASQQHSDNINDLAEGKYGVKKQRACSSRMH